MKQVEVTTWYLEMTDPAQFRPVWINNPDLNVIQAKIPCPEFSRFLYNSVGGNWYWLGRLDWTYEKWLTYLNRPEVQTWVAYLRGTPAGYIELESQPEGAIEIAYFGLLPQFIGQRIGGHLLSVGLQQAWAQDPRRVWVHTCDLDGPYALKNYQARGFSLYQTTHEMEEIPDSPLGSGIPV